MEAPGRHRRTRVESCPSGAYDPRHMPLGPGKVAISVGMAGLATAGFVFTLEAQQPLPARPWPRPARRARRRVLPLLSRRGREEGRARARHDRGAGRDAASGRVGEGRPEAARASDAAGRKAAAGRGAPTTRWSRRWRRRSTARPRRSPNPGRTATIRRLDANRIPERHPRSARARRRRRRAAARRRVQLRLRQRDGRRSLADAAGSLRLGGARRSAAWRSGARAARRAATRSGFAPDLTQEEHVDGLPVGTRGGAVVRYTFPLDGEYEIQIRLTRDRDEQVEGLSEPHELELLLDRERVQLFTVKPPSARRPRTADHDRSIEHLKIRVPVSAGPHDARRHLPEEAVGAARDAASAVPGALQFATGIRGFSRRSTPVSIVGPVSTAKGPGDTPSRRRIFVSRPAKPGEEDALREADPRDADAPGLPAAGHGRRSSRARSRSTGRRAAEAGFDAGIEMALSRGARQSGVPVPRRTGSGRRRAEHALSHQRSRTRVAAVVLPLEQHSGRRAARRWRSRESCTSRRCSSGRCGGCSPTRARGRS